MSSNDDDNMIHGQNSGSNDDNDDGFEVGTDGSVFSFSLDNSLHIFTMALIAYAMTLVAIVLVRLFGDRRGRK